MNGWFDIDRAGLANLLERKGKAWTVFELVQNAFDAEATNVRVSLRPVAGRAMADLCVVDNSPNGWANLDHAHTMFAKSSRIEDPEKRGRFNLGEKLVLSIASWASICTMSGTVEFRESGDRVRSKHCTKVGTSFDARVRMTREEQDNAVSEALSIIPPKGVELFVNGEEVHRPKRVAVFEAVLPTEFSRDGETLRPTTRKTTVEVFDVGFGGIWEMGIPVCGLDFPFALNVGQKVPLGMERDSVTERFRRALLVHATNVIADGLSEEEAAKPWATEALGDNRISDDAVRSLVKKRFGERAVSRSPGDPMSNATAEAEGCTVVSGGSLPADAWKSVRRANAMPAASTAYPTAAPPTEKRPVCKSCGRPI